MNDWCVRGGTNGRNTELTVGPMDALHYNYKLTLPADAMAALERMLHEGAARRYARIERAGMADATALAPLRPDHWSFVVADPMTSGLPWSFVTAPAATAELPTCGGWSVRLTVEERGAGDHAALSVGPLATEHHAFVVPFPADSLEDVAGLVEELRRRAEKLWAHAAA